MTDWYASMVGAPLTEREETVLAAVETGATNQQIGAALGISQHTVATHLIHIRRKLGAHTRVGLVKAAEARR